MRPQSIPLALASLLLSLILWVALYPQNIPEQQSRPLRVKVSYQGLPEDMVVTQMPTSITVTARGPNDRLKQIDEMELEAVATFDGTIQPGRKRVAVTIVPPRYKDFFPEREYATFTLERIATRRLDVEVETMGQLSDPLLALDDTLMDPTSITARGPESIVENLARARVLLDLSEISLANKDAQYVGVEAVLPNNTVPEGITVEPKVVKVTPVISSSPQQKQVSVDAQLTGAPPSGYMMAGYEVSPQIVTIRGTSRAIAAVTRITTEQINIEGITKNTDYVVNLQVPQGIAVTGSRRVRVRVMVNPTGNSTEPPPSTTNGQ